MIKIRLARTRPLNPWCICVCWPLALPSPSDITHYDHTPSWTRKWKHFNTISHSLHSIHVPRASFSLCQMNQIIFSCEDAALQVLMSVCLSVHVWPMLKFYLLQLFTRLPKVTHCYPRLPKVTHCYPWLPKFTKSFPRLSMVTKNYQKFPKVRTGMCKTNKSKFLAG